MMVQKNQVVEHSFRIMIKLISLQMFIGDSVDEFKNPVSLLCDFYFLFFVQLRMFIVVLKLAKAEKMLN